MAAYNVLSFGAKSDGHTDSAAAFLDAWSAACGDKKAATLVVPEGDFLVSRALFKGPCNNEDVQMLIKGNIVRNSGYCTEPEWITFKNVEGLTISGGTFDANGQSLWACKAAGHRCPTGSTALTIDQSKNVFLSGITVKNSEKFQMSIMYSQGIRVEGATITAPFNSPNTDGIHIHTTSGASIINSAIGTGDDCISLGTGAINIWIENIRCGPGHGISIGSLGETSSRSAVQNVTVSSVVLTGTENGLRIKTWAKPNSGFVRGVTFQHAIMNNVRNPIIIDQNYCPNHHDCPKQNSGIKISGVVFDDVRGSSATAVAVTLDCSRSNPCSGIELRDVRLSYDGEDKAEAVCKNAVGESSGLVIPPSCI